MKKLKIAIVVRTVDCGGFETVLFNLCEYFSYKTSHDITIITTSEKGRWFDHIKEYNIQRIHINGRLQTYPYRYAFKVGRLIKRHCFDIVILSNSERFCQAAIPMFDNGTVVIPWIHNDEPDAYAKALINKKYWNVAIGCGPKVASKAMQLSKGKQVLYIPNGIKIHSPSDLNKRQPISISLKLIFVGRIEQRSKGVFYLPDILERCIERKLPVTLTVIGDGSDLFMLKDKFMKKKLDTKVDFLGAIPNTKVQEYLYQSHILVMPSFYEGLPGVPLEAQGCGCVPIASYLPGITDVVINKNKTGFLIDVGDVDGFCEAIELLFKDERKWKEMSELGKDKVKNEFSIKAMGQRFEELFEDAKMGKYPLKYSRKWTLPVNPRAFTWREYVPRAIHDLGLGNRIRSVLQKIKN